MKCHYEVLGLSLQATDDEIKKAYRNFLTVEVYENINLKKQKRKKRKKERKKKIRKNDRKKRKK